MPPKSNAHISCLRIYYVFGENVLCLLVVLENYLLKYFRSSCTQFKNFLNSINPSFWRNSTFHTKYSYIFWQTCVTKVHIKFPSALDGMVPFPFGFEDSRSQGHLEKWSEHYTYFHYKICPPGEYGQYYCGLKNFISLFFYWGVKPFF